MIGVFGGTFDPPHHGHLILADSGRSALGLERVLWVVTADPPHKTNATISPLQVRLEMVGAAIGPDPNFELSRVDIDRPPPHYSHETLRLLREQAPDKAFTFLIGSDSLRDLLDWHRPDLLVERCEAIGVMERPGVDVGMEKIRQELPGIERKLRFFDAPHVDISGHEVRRRVREGLAYRYLVPRAVAEIIHEKSLYT